VPDATDPLDRFSMYLEQEALVRDPHASQLSLDHHRRELHPPQELAHG
jgi:hypothetical protein